MRSCPSLRSSPLTTALMLAGLILTVPAQAQSPVTHYEYDANGNRSKITRTLGQGNLITVLAAMHDMGFGGVNLTIPLKEIAYKGLTHLDESARLLGAVNTVLAGDETSVQAAASAVHRRSSPAAGSAP